MIVLADKGMAGRGLERYAEDQVKVLLVPLDRKRERRRHGNLDGMRQWIESVYDTAKVQDPGRRLRPHHPATAGSGQAIWDNWATDTTGLWCLTTCDSQ
jgi:hypothetical protein